MAKTARKSKNTKEAETTIKFRGKLYSVFPRGKGLGYAINVPEETLKKFAAIRDSGIFDETAFQHLVVKGEDYEDDDGNIHESYSVFGSAKEDLPTQIEYDFEGKIVQVKSPQYDKPGVFLNNLKATPVETDTPAATATPSKW